MSGVAALDGWLAALDPAARGHDLTRAIRWRMHQLHGFAVLGDGAAELVHHLARTWPDDVHAIVCDPPAGVTVADMLRAALRQDADLLVVPDARGADALVQTAVWTGHAVLVALPAGAAPPAGVHVVHLDGRRIVALDDPDDPGVVRLVDGRYVGPGLAPVTPPPLTRTLVRGRSAQPPAARDPRRSWIPVVGDDAIHGAFAADTARLDAGWPACRGCGRPLDHALELTLDDLPAHAEPGVLQLLLCRHGCDHASEAAPGVHLAVHRQPRPVAAPAPAGRPRPIAGWRARDEDPADEHGLGPWACDKLGGWPAWSQGEDTPRCPACDAPMALLFSLCDSPDVLVGSGPGWDPDRAESVPGLPTELVFDPDRPVCLPRWLTGDADVFVFRCAADDRLALRWQTG